MKAIYRQFDVISADNYRPGDLLQCQAGLYPDAEVEVIGQPRQGWQVVKTRSGRKVEVRADDLTVKK